MLENIWFRILMSPLENLSGTLQRYSTLVSVRFESRANFGNDANIIYN